MNVEIKDGKKLYVQYEIQSKYRHSFENRDKNSEPKYHWITEDATLNKNEIPKIIKNLLKQYPKMKIRIVRNVSRIVKVV